MDYPWEINAFNNDPVPDGLSRCEEHAYEALRYIYQLYKMGSVTKTDAAAEKGRIKAKLDADYRVESLNKKLAENYQKVLRATELAAIRYYKARTEENGLALCNAIQGLESDVYPGLNVFKGVTSDGTTV